MPKPYKKPQGGGTAAPPAKPKGVPNTPPRDGKAGKPKPQSKAKQKPQRIKPKNQGKPPKKPAQKKGKPPKNGGKKGPSKPYNPLEPTPPKQLRKQAARTMRAIFKPAFKQLGREESRVNALSQKRKSDNAYYLEWLQTQADQLAAHERGSNEALLKAGAEASSDVEEGYSALRDKLLATGEATPGVVSDPGDATAFDVSAEAQRDREMVEAARASTQSQIAASGQSSALAQANNFAVIAASEARRNADQWDALSKIGDAKQQLRLSRAAEAAKEVARLLDREIEKASIRGEQVASSRQSALEAARFGLDKKKFDLDLAEFDFEKGYKKKKLGLEAGRLGVSEQNANETERYHKATQRLKQAENRQEKKQASQEITAIIQEGISAISNNKKLQRLLSKDPAKVKRALMKILGSATAANAAVELVSTGKLNSTTRESLKQIGYIVPPKWR